MSWKLEIVSTEVLYYERYKRILDIYILKAKVKQKRPWKGENQSEKF